MGAAEEGRKAGEAIADQAIAADRKIRIIEGVAVTVTSGIILGTIYSVWESFTGKKKKR